MFRYSEFNKRTLRCVCVFFCISVFASWSVSSHRFRESEIENLISLCHSIDSKTEWDFRMASCPVSRRTAQSVHRITTFWGKFSISLSSHNWCGHCLCAVWQTHTLICQTVVRLASSKQTRFPVGATQCFTFNVLLSFCDRPTHTHTSATRCDKHRADKANRNERWAITWSNSLIRLTCQTVFWNPRVLHSDMYAALAEYTRLPIRLSSISVAAFMQNQSDHDDRNDAIEFMCVCVTERQTEKRYTGFEL